MLIYAIQKNEYKVNIAFDHTPTVIPNILATYRDLNRKKQETNV